MIAIIDYGLGNLRSIENVLRRAGFKAVVSSNRDVVAKASKLILPGVGHFRYGMEQLRDSGLLDLLDDLVIGKRRPILGICLGAQMLGRHSEEGDTKGLGWIDIETVPFDRARLTSLDKVPLMGWLETKCAPHPLFAGLQIPARFYYVHSYHFICADPKIAVATAVHGYEFVSAVATGNVMGVQFHPEKSHVFGSTVLMNFARMATE